MKKLLLLMIFLAIFACEKQEDKQSISIGDDDINTTKITATEMQFVGKWTIVLGSEAGIKEIEFIITNGEKHFTSYLIDADVFSEGTWRIEQDRLFIDIGGGEEIKYFTISIVSNDVIDLIGSEGEKEHYIRKMQD